MDAADKKIKKKSHIDLKKESDAVKQGEIEDKTHSIKTKILDFINKYIITIFFVILTITIFIIIIGLIFWYNLTDGIATITDKGRWEGYNEFVEKAKSSTIVALVAIMLKHKTKQ